MYPVTWVYTKLSCITNLVSLLNFSRLLLLILTIGLGNFSKKHTNLCLPHINQKLPGMFIEDVSLHLSKHHTTHCSLIHPLKLWKKKQGLLILHPLCVYLLQYIPLPRPSKYGKQKHSPRMKNVSLWHWYVTVFFSGMFSLRRKCLCQSVLKAVV